MGNRLTQIATRTGDDGTSGLADNTRLPKHHLRFAAMGDVDELNSHIGLLLCEPLPGGVRELLVDVQHQLFNLGGELSMPGHALLKDEAVLQLNTRARSMMRCPTELEVVPTATHLFEEPGTLEQVGRLAAAWFRRYLVPSAAPSPEGTS